MHAATMQFWFEFASTYSHLAAARVEAVTLAAGVRLEWKPFLLGPIFREQGWNDSPFNIYPVKGRYMWRDLERECEKYGVPFRRPSQFPRNGLLAARLAGTASSEPWCPAFVRAVYRANFAEDRDIADPATLAAILDALGQPAQQWLQQAQTPESKERLRTQTETARRLGIFGAPSFVVERELFWGNDRLEAAVAWSLRRATAAGSDAHPHPR
jgi:2-hydroxychromene-2-carboxylate isomerase